jgi:DNA-binding transcriptional LysR family regulator
MELRHFRDFVAVAEEMHFRRAAARLHVAQPSLTKQIKNLEEELGVPLFDRSKGAVALTAEGRLLLPYAQRILELSKRTVESFRGSTSPAAAIGVACLPTFCCQLALASLNIFKASHPNVTVHLSYMTRAEQLRALSNRSVDLGFIVDPGGLDSGALRVEPVARYAAVLALPANDPLARKRAIDLKDLKSRAVAILSSKSIPDYDEWTRHICEQNAVQRRALRGAPNEATLLAMVAAGAGAVLMPKRIKPRSYPGVVFRNPEPPISVECCAICRADNPSALLREYLQAVRRAAAA